MRTIKKVASHIFIDGFGGMTQGLFATLIIGTMIQQIGLLIGGSTGNVIYLLGKAAAALTSAGIGVGVAVKYGESPLVTVSAAVAAMVGGYAGKITGGTWHYAVHVYVGEAEIKLGLKFTAKNLKGIVDYTVTI